MTGPDEELEELRRGVDCACILERLGRGWKLDRSESTRRALKYRRGPGEIIIVNHEGRGWWDPCGTARGDVFSLMQHLEPGMNFRQVRKALRQLVGLSPSFPPSVPRRERRDVDRTIEETWTARPVLKTGSPTWVYLTAARGLTAEVVAAAGRDDVLREGPYGSAWFAHRDGQGVLTGIEMRGPDYRGFSANGQKSLFRLRFAEQEPARIAVLEAPIKAMAFAALDGLRADTLYAGTAGGMGPGTVACLEDVLSAIAGRAGGALIAASDADEQGEKYAARLAAMAEAVGLPCTRAAPVGFKDWDDVLKARGPVPATVARRPREVAATRARKGT
jgi:hypothetical protein